MIKGDLFFKAKFTVFETKFHFAFYFHQLYGAISRIRDIDYLNEVYNFKKCAKQAKPRHYYLHEKPFYLTDDFFLAIFRQLHRCGNILCLLSKDFKSFSE